MKQRGTRRAGQVKRDGAFVRVQVLKKSAVFRIGDVRGERPPPPRRIAFRRLDLDHVSAQQRHQLGAKRRRHALSGLDHPNPGQSQASCGLSISNPVSQVALLSGCREQPEVWFQSQCCCNALSYAIFSALSPLYSHYSLRQIALTGGQPGIRASDRVISSFLLLAWTGHGAENESTS